MSKIYIGSCSWADKSLIESGNFYPEFAKDSESRLKYYSSVFNCVEVDSSFYAIPSEKNSQLWVERTPADFIFNVKAFGAMTGHSISVKSLPADLRKSISIKAGDRLFINEKAILFEIFNLFKKAIEPIKVAGKLGIVVFQYPPWFQNSERSKTNILFAKEKMDGFPIGVEFRNRSWLDESGRADTLKFLRDNGITYIISDAPQVVSEKTVQYYVDNTSDIAYFRFHGRNTENWLKRGVDASLRYDYEYCEDELKGFADDINLIKGRVKKLFAMFNNHRGSQAVRNALSLKRILLH
ncbi:MAG: DUF72 domain-containing protein [Myxococcota bacterium]